MVEILVGGRMASYLSQTASELIKVQVNFYKKFKLEYERSFTEISTLIPNRQKILYDLVQSSMTDLMSHAEVLYDQELKSRLCLLEKITKRLISNYRLAKETESRLPAFGKELAIKALEEIGALMETLDKKHHEIISHIQNFFLRKEIYDEISKSINAGNPSLLLRVIQSKFASLPYSVFLNTKEATYQGFLIVMLEGMRLDLISERATNTGRIDVVFNSLHVTYILELKLDGCSREALKQIREKQYFKPYTHKSKQIIIIGINFSSELRNISEWNGELLSESGEKIKDILHESGD